MWKRGAAIGLIVSALSLAVAVPLHHNSADMLSANVTDPVVTAAIAPAQPSAVRRTNPAIPPAVAPTQGSPAFRTALQTAMTGDGAAGFALARALPDPLERHTVEWSAIHYHGGVVPYQSIVDFAAEAPKFGAASIAKTRIEQSLLKASPTDAEIIKVLGATIPNTLDAQIMLAKAYFATGETARATALTRTVWTTNFLTPEQEARVLADLGTLLDHDSHWARAVNLMMNDRATASERLLPFLTTAQQGLVVSRAAVSRNAANAKALLDGVDPSLQTHPVFIFSRVQRARQADLFTSAIDWLSKAKVKGDAELPNSAQWWYERRALVRQLLDLGKPELAYKAAAGYSTGPDGRLVDAQFHAGWIALSFLDDPKAAAAHFELMRSVSTLPDTVSQSNFWLGRALEKLGNTPGAKAAFTRAAAYTTVYYGLLARSELGLTDSHVRPLPGWKSSQALFDTNEIVRAVRLLAANNQQARAVPLLRNFALDLKSGGELLLAARLAQDIGAHNLAIAIAETAEGQGIPLDLISFPEDGMPANATLAADKAAVYAIARQESMFQADAVSSAGARGLMQLMPGTAQDTAKKLGLDYSAARLTTDPAYNALLGSTYLGDQLRRYNGSLVLAAAAYNAGPGNANKWIRAYGDPRQPNVDPLVWVELIPFQETRKYVQRVFGNYLIYRERLGAPTLTITEALRSID